MEWTAFVKKVYDENPNLTYKQAMQKASKMYIKASKMYKTKYNKWILSSSFCVECNMVKMYEKKAKKMHNQAKKMHNQAK